MPELRKDPAVGRWVIVATERARRPGNFVSPVKNETEAKDCPFCKDDGSVEVYKVSEANGKGWKVRVVKSGTPIVNERESPERRRQGMYEVCGGYGAHEVVIETPEHIADMADLPVEQIKTVFETYAARINHHRQNADFEYVLAYKNYGWMAGSRKIGHSRSQIIATSVNPIRVKDKIAGAKKYFDANKRCLYCAMITQEKDFAKRVVLETDHFIAITPFASRFPFELAIIPKKHHCYFSDGIQGLEIELAKVVKELLLKIKIGLQSPAYNYIIHSAPFHGGEGESYKTIQEDYHWHMELTPRLTRVAGFEKGSGFYICSIPPEDTAAFLRGVETQNFASLRKEAV